MRVTYSSSSDLRYGDWLRAAPPKAKPSTSKTERRKAFDELYSMNEFTLALDFEQEDNFDCEEPTLDSETRPHFEELREYEEEMRLRERGIVTTVDVKMDKATRILESKEKGPTYQQIVDAIGIDETRAIVDNFSRAITSHTSNVHTHEHFGDGVMDTRQVKSNYSGQKGSFIEATLVEHSQEWITVRGNERLKGKQVRDSPTIVSTKPCESVLRVSNEPLKLASQNIGQIFKNEFALTAKAYPEEKTLK
ncbi:hypothetical protein PanWU01x14_325270 [Parasponia andersonii]|uniref:Uncharacterized protein n=1 Tax=Parasponia andersonii TaxID=3476 RepID=A0A2P5AJV5_PARAD|nr:hypothetical protein PanWU01x14_325270 [Parasponia andersonii]